MKIIAVEWLDSHRTDEWTPKDELPEPKGKMILTVGIEVGRSDRGVSVASSIGDDPKQACGVMTIPTCCIVDERELPFRQGDIEFHWHLSNAESEG